MLLRCNVLHKALSRNFHLTSPHGASRGLQKIRICDMTSGLAGPYCSMILGDMGAEVIKVENHKGDESRHWRPPFVGGESCYFLSVNRNKKSMEIDIESEKGKNILKELVHKSDVFIENFVPGKMSELGFGYESLKQINPELVYASISGFGSHGPGPKKPGYDIIASAMGGFLSITGPKNGDGFPVGVSVTEIMTSLYTSSAILAALYEREATKKGKQISSSIFQTQLAYLSHIGSNYLNTGKLSKTLGTSHASIVPYQALRTGDEMIIIAATNEKHFQNACKALDIQHLVTDERFTNNQKRVANRDVLIGLLEERLISSKARYWIKLLEEASVPCSLVNTVKQAYSSEQAIALDMIQTVEHESYGKVKLPGRAIHYNNSFTPLPPPLLGEHTRDVLKNILHYSEDEIESILRNNKNT